MKLTILLLRAVFTIDLVEEEGNQSLCGWVSECCGKRLMGMLDSTVTMAIFQAMPTASFLAAKILETIDKKRIINTQHSIVQPSSSLLKALKNWSERILQNLCIGTVEKSTKLRSLWNVLNSEDSAKIVPSMPLLKTSLERQHGRLLHKHHG